MNIWNELRKQLTDEFDTTDLRVLMTAIILLAIAGVIIVLIGWFTWLGVRAGTIIGLGAVVFFRAFYKFLWWEKQEDEGRAL